MLDLLLVNAPSRQRVYGGLTELAAVEPPVWAGLIARHCLNKGFSVQILDAEAEGLTINQAIHRINEAHPRLIAFSIYGQQPSASTQCLPAASAVARTMRDQGWYIPTLAFGTHPSALPEKTLREEGFDYVVGGEGLRTIIPILENLRRENPADPFTPFSNDFQWPIGLYRLAGGGLSHSNGWPPSITNLDAELPSQAWELLDMKRYRAHNWHLWTAQYGTVTAIEDGTRSLYTGPLGGYASVQTSLGCPFACSFCCIQAPFGARGIRYWSPNIVVRQINSLANDYGITNIKIPDEMFTLNPERVKDICWQLIHSDKAGTVPLNLWAYARVDTVKDTEMLDLMRRAGFRWLGIGVESGSKHVRDGVEKGRFDSEDIREAIERVQTAGIAVAANYIFGLPDDTAASMQETLDLACELNTEWANFYCAMAYPGSPLHEQARRTNPHVLPENNPCGWLGYSQHAPEILPLPTATLTAAQVLAFRDEAFMSYFSRPEYRTLIVDQFGFNAGDSLVRMLTLGKPKRNILGG